MKISLQFLIIAVCKFDEYFSGDGICQKCYPTCVTCFGETKTDCFKCKGYMFKQECVDDCPTNYFKEQNKQICETCNIPYCKKCLNSKTCDTCEDNFQLSSSKDSCIYQQSNKFNYAYYDITQQHLVEVQSCPDFLESNRDSHTCSYPKICSQENYVGEFNSNCFNIDEGGLKMLIQPFYSYYYTKKEVYVFDWENYQYQFYLQDLNSDKNIQTIAGVDNSIFIVYDNSILVYNLGVSQLTIEISMPKSVQNNQYTQILPNVKATSSGIWLITTSISLQDSKYSLIQIVDIQFYYYYLVYVLDLNSPETIKYSFQIGQKIFQYFIIPEKTELIIVTLLRITVYKSYIEQIEPMVYLEIGEESQVNWIKSFAQEYDSTEKGKQERIFVILNGWSIFIFDSINYTLTQVVAKSDDGFILDEIKLIAIINYDKLSFMKIEDLIIKCQNDKQCLKTFQNLIMKSQTISPLDQYLIAAIDNQIYITVKNSFEVYIYDRSFNLKSIYSDFSKPIKSIYTYLKTNNYLSDKITQKYLVITHNNNAKIFTQDNKPFQLFSFCNEKNIEVFNEEIKEFGAVGQDEMRNILIYAAVSIQGNLVIFMKKKGQALFYKEFQGDNTINRLQMVRKNFQIFVNSEKRLIKLFGIINSQGNHLVITIEYFNFKISQDYEVYYSVDSIISNSVFLAKEEQTDHSCVYYFQVDNQKSKQVYCLSPSIYQQVQAADKYITISFVSEDERNNYIRIFSKDNPTVYKEQKVQYKSFSFEFLDNATILIIATGKFQKFKVQDVPIDSVQEFQNSISDRIKHYQIESNSSWMIIQEQRGDQNFFHFIDLISSNLSQVDVDIQPLTTQDDINYFPYVGSSCSFMIMQSTLNKTPFFQIISSQLGFQYGNQQSYKNTVVSYQVISNSSFKMVGKKRIEQFQRGEDQQIIEGAYSQSKLLFYNQINIKEQINVLCSISCQIDGKLDSNQLLYQRWHLPNILRQLSTDKIFLEDYYMNTMYSDKWHVLGIEAYLSPDKKPLTNRRIELIKYPEKAVIFTYYIDKLCNLFTFQIVSTYDTLLICDNMSILVFSLYNINQNYQNYLENPDQPLKQAVHTYKYVLNYSSQVDQYAYFSQLDPFIYFNSYGAYDFIKNIFYPQTELLIYTKGKDGQQQTMENDTHFYYSIDSFIYFYNKQKITTTVNAALSYDATVIFLNKKYELPYLERDFIIGLTQLRDQQQVQIFDYQNFNPIKSFYELDQEQFSKLGYYYYCWQYQKLFLRYDSSILGYQYPFSAVQEPFLTYKTKTDIPRACSDSYLVVYENTIDRCKIKFISYADSSIIKEITLFINVQRLQLDLFIKQKNIAIIEDKQIIVIGNILISTSSSDFYYIFQDSKFHYSPSLDIAFIHQQSLERYIQIIDLSQMFPFIQERFSFETNLSFQNYYQQKDPNSDSLDTQNSNQNISSDPLSQIPTRKGQLIKDFTKDDLVFINLIQGRVCIYNTKLQNYILLKLPELPPSKNLEAMVNRKMQYTIYLNQDEKRTLAVINFDRDFYLYSYNKWLKTLNLADYQEIHIDKEDNKVFIYAFKNEQLFYITLDNQKEDFVKTQINLSQFNFTNYLLIARGYNMSFAVIDTNHTLIAQKSMSDQQQCSVKLPDTFINNVRGIKVEKLQLDAKTQDYIILVWTNNELNIYNIKCQLMWSKKKIVEGITQELVDDQTKQIYLSDKYFIYIIRYADVLTPQTKDITLAKFPLQARGYIQFQKLNVNLLGVLSYSNVYIFQVKDSFASMFYITNKDFSYIKQVFIVLNEFLIISDINRLYIYQILSDENDYLMQKLIKSRNSLSGSSSFSSSSSNNSSQYSNQGDNSEYYSQQQFSQRKQVVLFYTQTNLYIQILQISTVFQDQTTFVRIIGSDYNNLIDFTKQLKINDIRVQEVPKLNLKDSSQMNNEQSANTIYNNLFQGQILTLQQLTKLSCRGEYVIHKKKDYQIIQYDTIYLQNDGLYNQIFFRYPPFDNDPTEQEPISDLFIPNSLKLKTKKATDFVYDLNGNTIKLQPYIIKSSIIGKLIIMNGIIESITVQQGLRNLKQKAIRMRELEKQSQHFKRNLSFPSSLPNYIEQFSTVHLKDLVIRQSLSFSNCQQIILENVEIPLQETQSKIYFDFNMPENTLTSVTIYNMTVHASILFRDFIRITNANLVNITNLTVQGTQKDFYRLNEFQYNLFQNWIAIFSSKSVTMENVSFNQTNSNLDLFYLQDIDYVYLNHFTFMNFSKNFYQDYSNPHPPQMDFNQLKLNDKGEVIDNQQSLQYYTNLPLNTTSFSSIFKVIYIKNVLNITDISIINSTVSSLMHFNKTIILNSQTNPNIKEQYESTILKVIINKINIELLTQLTENTCLINDFIIIEALNVNIDDIKLNSTSCLQSFFRCISCEVTHISKVDISSVDMVNFLFYFIKNQEIIIENITIQNCNNLQQIIGIVNSSKSKITNLQIYPYIQDESGSKNMTQLIIRNCALFLFQELEQAAQFEMNSQFSRVDIYNSNIQYLKSDNSNGTAIQSYYISLSLKNVTFNNNQAGQNGGAIYLQYSTLKLVNTQVYQNNATLSGGAIYSTSSNIEVIDDMTKYKNETLISNNSASIGGGIRYFKYKIKIISQNPKYLSNNKAIFFGKDYANYPSNLVLKDIEQSKHIQDVVSSISTIQQEISFYWIDQHQRQLIYKSSEVNIKDPKYSVLKKELDQYTTVFMSSDFIWINRVRTEVDAKGEVISSPDNSQYVKTSQSFLLKPKQQGHLTLKTFINYPEDEGIAFEQKQKECIAGEVFNSFNQECYECLECKDNTYLLTKPTSFDNKCLLCPDDAKKCYKNIIELYDEYWIEPNTSNIQYCYNSPDKCKPQEINGCSEGGYGPRCESCDYMGQVWKGKNYAKYGRFKCQECGEEDASQYAIIIILIVLFGLFQAYLALKVTIQTQTTLLGHYLKRAGIINLGLSIQGIGFNSLIKFIVGYLQIIQVLTSFNFKFSLGFLRAIYFFGDPLQISYFFLDCLYIKLRWIYSLEIVYIRLIWILINTLIYLFISFLVSICYVFYTKRQSKQKRIIIFRFTRTSVYYVFYLMFPSLISQFINIISCENIGTKKYIYSDNQFLCNSQYHLLIGYPIAIPLLVLMTIIFPTFVYFQLKKNKNNLYHISFYLKYRFFFSEYKDSCYYWELVKMAQKGLIYIGLSIYNENQIAKGAIVSLIMTIYIRFIYILKPYKRIFLNQIEFAASFTLLICFQVGMINMASSNTSVQSISFYLIIFSNVFFVLYFLIMVFKEGIPYHKNMVAFSCIEISIKKFPILKNIFHRSESIYISHKAWTKVRNTIKRIGYQKLPLYLQNNNAPSIAFSIPQNNQNSHSPQQSQSQKSIGSETVGTREMLNFQPQVIFPTIKQQKGHKKSLLCPQTQDLDVKAFQKQRIPQKASEQELALIESLGQSQSQTIKIPDENILSPIGINDLNTQNELQTTVAQKLNTCENRFFLSPKSDNQK